MLQQIVRGVIAITGLTVLTTTVAVAQQDQEKRFALQVGLSSLTGPERSIYQSGAQVGGVIQLAPNIRVNLDWTRHGAKSDYARRQMIAGGLDDVNQEIILVGGMVNTVIPFMESGGPYVLAGAGYYAQQYLRTETNYVGFNKRYEGNDGDFAWNLGLGVTGKRLYAEARYQAIEFEGARIRSYPIVLGLKF